MLPGTSSRNSFRPTRNAAAAVYAGLALSLSGCGGSGGESSSTAAPPASTSAVSHTTTAGPVETTTTIAPGIPSDNYALTWGANDCFVQPTYQEDDVVIRSNISYVTTFDPKTQENITLLLDVYSPPDADARLSRPAVVLMHGGAFTINSKTDDIPPWAKQMAARGYVVLSIDYRLATDAMVLENPLAVISRVAQDARASVRFLRSKASEWRVDPRRIAVGGGSAGAMAALFYGFMDKAQAADGPVIADDPATYSSAVNGVISLAGAMNMQAFCAAVDPETYEPTGCEINLDDFTQDLVAGDVPVIEIHGTADQVVPYINGREVTRRAEDVNVRNELFTAVGVGHMPEITDFLLTNATVRDAVYTFISGMLNTAEAVCPVQQVVV